jgi:hypothetical protein
VVVSIAVIAVLIGLLAPSLSGVRETTRRVVCSSNIKQVGLGVVTYGNDFKSHLPPSTFSAKRSDFGQPQNMMTVRLGGSAPQWDGLGILYGADYTSAPGVFYCPSHHGEHRFNRYAGDWAQPSVEASLVCNYHYRGGSASGETRLDVLERLTPVITLVSDGLATRGDYNHRDACNFLRADMSVALFADSNRRLFAMLAMNSADIQAGNRVRVAWNILDEGSVEAAAAEDPEGTP